VRRLRRLLHRSAQRRAEGVFVAEGVEVVRTGLASGHVPESLYLDAGAAEREPEIAALAASAAASGARVLELAPGVLGRVASTVTPQPVLGVFRAVDLPAVPAGARLVVVMAEVRDPGNAGTVLRTADAAGVDAVVACAGAVDPYNPKAVRSSAGSIFHVPLVLGGEPGSVLDALRGSGLRCLGAVVRDGVDYTEVDWTVPSAIVLGNEAAGLSAALVVDGGVGIPMAGRAESLNVAMACAVLCFEALRQRRGRAPGASAPASAADGAA
jgi:TrmH family RNA methyltransferase